MLIKKCTKTDKDVIRQIARRYNIKGVRQPLHAVTVGRQTHKIDPIAASGFVQEVERAGFYVEPIWQGAPLIDTFMIWRKG